MTLYSRPGNDLTDRFSLIVEALARLRVRSCIIDGEAVVCDDTGIARFNRIRYRSYDDCVFLYAFDLIELSGEDMRREPLQVRKATLASVVAKANAGIRFNEHMECEDGEAVFRHACKMGRLNTQNHETRALSRVAGHEAATQLTGHISGASHAKATRNL